MGRGEWERAGNNKWKKMGHKAGRKSLPGLSLDPLVIGFFDSSPPASARSQGGAGDACMNPS